MWQEFMHLLPGQAGYDPGGVLSCGYGDIHGNYPHAAGRQSKLHLSVINPQALISCLGRTDRILQYAPIGISDGAFCAAKRSRGSAGSGMEKSGTERLLSISAAIILNKYKNIVQKQIISKEDKSCELFSFPGIDTIRDNTEVCMRYHGWRAVKTENF